MRRAVPTALAAALLTVGLAAPADASRRHRDRDSCEEDCTRSGDGDRKNNHYCVLPCDFVIIVPMPSQPGPDEQAAAGPAAMLPPDPAKIAELIQTFASGMGKAVGDLAGAIAAFPPALLL